jgi:hypothetical protein
MSRRKTCDSRAVPEDTQHLPPPLDLIEYAVLSTVGLCGDYWYSFDVVCRLKDDSHTLEQSNQDLIRALKDLMTAGFVEAAPVRDDRVQRHERTANPASVDWSRFAGWTHRTAEEMIRKGRMIAPPFDFSLTESGEAEMRRTEYCAFDEKLDRLDD